MLFANREMTPSSLIGFLHFQPIYLFLPTDHHFIERDLLLGRHKRKCWKKLIRNAMEHWVIKNEVEMEKIKTFSFMFWRDTFNTYAKEKHKQFHHLPIHHLCLIQPTEKWKNDFQKCRCFTLWMILFGYASGFPQNLQNITFGILTPRKNVLSSFHNRGNH